MIILSAHRDTVMPCYRFEYSNGHYVGLLDNIIGVMMASSLMSDGNVAALEKEGRIKIIYPQGEEWGLDNDLPKTDKKKDVVIVVDVASGGRYKGFDFSVENIWGFTDKQIKDILGSMKWEGFNPLFRKYTGNTEDADEAFSWVKRKQKVLSFIIPIENGSASTGWHVDDCKLSIEKYNLCKRGLTRLINYLV